MGFACNLLACGVLFPAPQKVVVSIPDNGSPGIVQGLSGYPRLPELQWQSVPGTAGFGTLHARIGRVLMSAVAVLFKM